MMTLHSLQNVVRNTMLSDSVISQVLSLIALCILIKELLSIEDESLLFSCKNYPLGFKKHCPQLRTFPSESNIKCTEQRCNLMPKSILVLLSLHTINRST